jgi:hypothetical protein
MYIKLAEINGIPINYPQLGGKTQL